MPFGFLASVAKKVVNVAADAVDGGDFAWGAGGGATSGVRRALGENIVRPRPGASPVAAIGGGNALVPQPASLFPTPQELETYGPAVGQMQALTTPAAIGPAAGAVTAAVRLAIRQAIVQAKRMGVPRSGVKAWLRSNPTMAQILTITGIGVVIDEIIDAVYGPGGGSNGMVTMGDCMIPVQCTVEPSQQARRTCPRGYVLVKLPDGGATCMLREYAIKHKFYRPRKKPPISASEMRTLRRARTTTKKLLRIADRSIELDKRMKTAARRR